MGNGLFREVRGAAQRVAEQRLEYLRGDINIEGFQDGKRLDVRFETNGAECFGGCSPFTRYNYTEDRTTMYEELCPQSSDIFYCPDRREVVLGTRLELVEGYKCEFRCRQDASSGGILTGCSGSSINEEGTSDIVTDVVTLSDVRYVPDAPVDDAWNPDAEVSMSPDILDTPDITGIPDTPAIPDTTATEIADGAEETVEIASPETQQETTGPQVARPFFFNGIPEFSDPAYRLHFDENGQECNEDYPDLFAACLSLHKYDGEEMPVNETDTTENPNASLGAQLYFGQGNLITEESIDGTNYYSILPIIIRRLNIEVAEETVPAEEPASFNILDGEHDGNYVVQYTQLECRPDNCTTELLPGSEEGVRTDPAMATVTWSIVQYTNYLNLPGDPVTIGRVEVTPIQIYRDGTFVTAYKMYIEGDFSTPATDQLCSGVWVYDPTVTIEAADCLHNPTGE